MSGRCAGVALFLWAVVSGLVGCGNGESGEHRPPNSMMTDLRFEGAFISRTFECVNGGGAIPVSRASELRRTMLIVSDRILVTDANSWELFQEKARPVGPGLGMVNAVTRYYEVKKRAEYRLSVGAMWIEIRQPTDGTVSTMATSFEGQAVRDRQFHPITAALKSAERQIWIYAFEGPLLHVYQPDAPESICGKRGYNLRTIFERRQFN